MPVFHTKTIESILDPVAQQVSRLVIIHEEGEAGHEMPDLERPVLAVSKAVANLAKVGREMVTTTDDGILRQDMPLAITKVENAASLLEDASNISKEEPYSKTARTKLIEGSRWILQGTSSVLLCFDESEVRKIIRECKKVLDYLSVAEVIDSMEDLVQFVKDLSPCLSKVTREVEKRVEDLTHQVHRESLSKCVDQIKTLAPILICSMKIFIQILTQGGKGSDEAAENRNYLAARMTEEVGEIIRVLQLVTYDEEEWSSDNIQVMRKTLGSIDGKMQGALDWLREPMAMQGGAGERSLRAIVEQAEKVAERSLPMDAEHLRRLAGDVTAMTDALCELRAGGRGTTPQAENLARNIQSRMGEVAASVGQAVSRLEKSGIQQPAPTVSGRLEQARRWLEQPGLDDRGVGPQALALILEEARKVAEGLPAGLRGEISGLCSRVEAEQARLLEAVRRGEADTPQAVALARSLTNNIGAVADCIQGALVDRVVEDFIDIATPLKQFMDCVLSPGDPAMREQVFDVKSAALVNFSGRVVSTARLVATGNTSGNKKLAEALLAAAGQVDSLTPQLVNAGRIRMVYPENKAADEHFENLRRQYAETVSLTRQLADEATDSARFVGQSAAAMQQHTARCDEAIATRQPNKMVESTSAIARLANRVLQVTKNEAENSEDPRYIATLNIAADQLQTRVSPMVQFAKSVALNIDDQAAVVGWRRQNQALLEAVQGVHQAVSDHSGGEQQPPLPPYPDLGNLSINQDKKKMAKVSNGSALSSSLPSSEPAIRVFSDDELSEIFQIDFGQIFGNPESGLKSSYRGIQSKRGVSRSNSAAAVPSAAATFSPLPPPEQFQSSPALARRPTPQAAGALSLRDGGSDQQSLHQSHSSSAIAHQGKSNSVQKSQSYSQQQSFSSQQTFSSQQSSSFQTSNVTTAHKQVVDSPAPPPAPRPIISEPPAKIKTSTAAEADVLIEELMEEAKNDPSFGVMDRLSSRQASPPVDPDRVERGPPGGGVQVLPSVHQERADSRGPYPFIPRPFRSGADMIIRDRSEEPLDAGSRMSRTPDRHPMPSRPYRTATDFKIDDTSSRDAAYKRSQSADGRNGHALGVADPKVTNFKRTTSTDNFTGEMMKEVVGDTKNRSVKDLVAQLETSTKSQSDNAYIRKWGCDLISHEPRKKNVTLRWQRKDLPDPEFASRLQNQYSDYGSRTSSRARNLSEGSMSREDSPSRQDSRFHMSDYTADLDDLITDREHTEQDISLAAEEVEVEPIGSSPSKVVVWPPASPTPGALNGASQATGNAMVTNNTVMSGSQMAMSSSVFQMSSSSMQGTSVTERKYQVTEPVSPVMAPAHDARNFIVSEAENLVKKRKTKKLMKKDKVEEMNMKNSMRSATNSSRSGPKYTRDSLVELDNQIMDIQTGFEAELESLIDMYKGIQKRKSQGFHSVAKTSEDLSTLNTQNNSIRETAELLCQELSDDEGTYQAVDIVFDAPLCKDGDAPPRPPPPSGGGQYGSLAPPRPPPPDTDDEADNMFEHAPTPSQGPIMMAAHELHQEVRQWSSKDNDIIAAAKKMALLMAKLSQLVQEDSGSKRELIAIAKAIAESSDEVTRLAKELAKECTDKRMRTNLLQVCERIPTIGTQLKILSTVKATMLGAQGRTPGGTDEDIEATEMLVGNAQNLMQSVKQTVTAAEAASIKIRTDAGIRLKWVRKQPWYHY